MKVVRSTKIQNAINHARKEHGKRTQIALRIIKKNAAQKKRIKELKENAAKNFHDEYGQQEARRQFNDCAK